MAISGVWVKRTINGGIGQLAQIVFSIVAGDEGALPTVGVPGFPVWVASPISIIFGTTAPDALTYELEDMDGEALSAAATISSGGLQTLDDLLVPCPNGFQIALSGNTTAGAIVTIKVPIQRG